MTYSLLILRTEKKILKKFSSLESTKACQLSEILTKNIKENADKFFISCLMLQSMKEPFHQFSKWLMLPQFLERVLRTLKVIADQSAFLKHCQTYLKKVCIDRWLSSWINTLPNFNVALEKPIAHTSHCIH